MNLRRLSIAAILASGTGLAQEPEKRARRITAEVRCFYP